MAALLGIFMLAGSSPAWAQGTASPWFSTDQGRVRLIAASPDLGAGESVQLGLQFELAPHWKIYWRSPGDAGYPPRLDWTGSRNLAAADIAWPLVTVAMITRAPPIFRSSAAGSSLVLSM